MRALALRASLSLFGSAALAAAPCSAPDAPASGLRELDSPALARLMGAGWNLGNSMEAIGGETAWGQPPATQALMDAVKAAGFKSVRIPVAWHQYADAQDRISPAWLARVEQVVGYACRAGLYAMINVHWDGGWLQPTRAAEPQARARLQSYWQQLAEHFRSHGDLLLFAGTNEVMVEGDWGPPKPEYSAVQNGFNQLFVDTVRASDGNNRLRHLVVQGFNTNVEHTLNFAVLPKDPTPARLMMEVHYYDPFRYTLDEKSPLWQWGVTTTDRSAADTWGNEDHLQAQFARLQQRYVKAGVPVVLGEFGTIARAQPGADAFRLRWYQAVARAAAEHGLVPMVWDNGGNGLHGMGLLRRSDGVLTQPALVRALVEAAR